jgi:hypothetical protein
MIENWTNPSALGPIYPGQGSEILLLLLGVFAWIVWTIWQANHENASHRRNAEQLRSEKPSLRGSAENPPSSGSGESSRGP